jgi:hypothetical protein
MHVNERDQLTALLQLSRVQYPAQFRPPLFWNSTHWKGQHSHPADVLCCVLHSRQWISSKQLRRGTQAAKTCTRLVTVDYSFKFEMKENSVRIEGDNIQQRSGNLGDNEGIAVC